MRKLLLIAATAGFVTLGGCSAIQTANTPVDRVPLQKTAFAARATYVGLLEAAVNVTDLPRCERAKPPCVTQPVVNQIRVAQKAAGDATKSADSMVRDLKADPTVLTLAVDTATRSVTVFQNAIDRSK